MILNTNSQNGKLCNTYFIINITNTHLYLKFYKNQLLIVYLPTTEE